MNFPCSNICLENKKTSWSSPKKVRVRKKYFSFLCHHSEKVKITVFMRKDAVHIGKGKLIAFAFMSTQKVFVKVPFKILFIGFPATCSLWQEQQSLT